MSPPLRVRESAANDHLEAMMNAVVSRKTDGFSSPFRQPRFVIGGSALGALMALELAAALLMGRFA